MSLIEKSRVWNKSLNFLPTIEEQIKLNQIHTNHLIVNYQDAHQLFRMLCMLIQLYYSKGKKNTDYPRFLFITQKKSQDRTKELLQANLKQVVMIHNNRMLSHARKQDYFRYSLLISTAQIIKNDFKAKLFQSNHFSIIFIAEIEKGTGSALIQYIRKNLTPTQFIGFSQLKNFDRLKQICKNLKMTSIISLNSKSKALSNINIQHHSVSLPEEQFFIIDTLDRVKKNEILFLESRGFKLGKKNINAEIAAIHQTLLAEGRHELLINTATIQRITRLQKIVISQGFVSALKFYLKLETQYKNSSKQIGDSALKAFLKHPVLKRVRDYISFNQEMEHPKFQYLLKLIHDYKSGIILIMKNFEYAKMVNKKLEENVVSTLLIEQSISSIKGVHVERELNAFCKGKAKVCIINTINDQVARLADIVIVYDIEAHVFEDIFKLKEKIPIIILFTKNTTEEENFRRLIRKRHYYN